MMVLDSEKIVNLKDATYSERMKVLELFRRNYELLLKEMEADADYVKLTAYWSDFDPHGLLVSAKDFIEKYESLLPTANSVKNSNMNLTEEEEKGMTWYVYAREYHPDSLGTAIIAYVEKLQSEIQDWTSIEDAMPDKEHIKKRTQFLVRGYYQFGDSIGNTHHDVCRLITYFPDDVATTMFESPSNFHVVDWMPIKE